MHKEIRIKKKKTTWDLINIPDDIHIFLNVSIGIFMHVYIHVHTYVRCSSSNPQPHGEGANTISFEHNFFLILTCIFIKIYPNEMNKSMILKLNEKSIWSKTWELYIISINITWNDNEGGFNLFQY